MSFQTRASIAEAELKRLCGASDAGHNDEAILMTEIESIAEAFDNVQKQNSSLLKQMSEKDEIINKLSSEVLGQISGIFLKC